MALKRLLIALASVLVGLTDFAIAADLSKDQAIKAAEVFILQNGYTDTPKEKIKAVLDKESIERSSDRDKLLESRFNSLKPEAIGIRQRTKSGNPGWSVAFDFARAETNSRTRKVCRVVTMNADGSKMRLEHVDGFRDAFAGFE